MANALYDTFKADLLNNAAAFDLGNDSIEADLIDSADYTFSAAHNEAAGGATDVAAGAIVANVALSSLSVSTAGVFDSADFTWSSVTGDQSEAIILLDGTLANDRLILFMDTGITGMPVTPNGGDINGTVNGSGWFAL